jgi:phospholipid/cholesterol/gamma-HCH transport system substrate-binding protein
MRRRDEVLVGVFTLVAIAVLVTGALWLARGGLSRGYPLYAKFEWGAGLKQGQPVLFSGVNVGYVDGVQLLENGGLVVTLRVYKKQRVPEGTVASIAPNGIFGDMLIALRATKGPTGHMLQAGDTIPSAPGSAQLGDVIGRVDSIAASLNKLILALHNELIDQHTIADVRKVLASADNMVRTITQMAADQSKELSKTQETLRRVATAVDSAQIDSTLKGFRSASTHVTALLEDFRVTNARLNGILAKIDTGNGTAAKLINDAKLETDVRALLVRLDSLMADFMKNPRKYIKLSIF